MTTQTRQKQKSIRGLLFSKGKKVEVSLRRVEHPEVWYPAIVQEDTGDNSFLVEYQCLGKNDVLDSVKVKVDVLHIRPSPPVLKGKHFDLLEKVDTYINFGWWSGVITKELPDNKYLIFFKETKNERLVNQSEIRPHMEWKEGNWFSAFQDVSKSPDYQGSARNVGYNAHQTEMVSPGSLVSLRGNSEERGAGSINLLDIQNERSTPSNLEPSTIMTSQRKKANLLNTDTDERTKKIKHANKSDLPLLRIDDLNTSPIIAPGKEIHFGSATATNGSARTNNTEQSMVDMPSDNFSPGKRARSKRHKSVELENHTPNPPRRNVGRPPKSPISETQALAGDKRDGKLDQCTPEPLGRKSEMLSMAEVSGAETSGDKNDAAARCTREDLQKQCVTEEVPFTRNLEIEVIEGSQAEVLPLIPTEELLEVSGDQEKRVDDPVVVGIKEADKLEERVESIGKRKRGRPPKQLPKNPEGGQQNGGKKLAKSPEFGQRNGGKKLAKSPEVSWWNGGVAAADMALGEVLFPVVVVGLEATKVDGSVSNKEKLRVDKNILNASVDLKSKSSSNIEVYPGEKDEPQTRKVVQSSVEKHGKDLSKRGRRRTISINMESPNQDPKDPSVGKMAEVNGKDSLVKEAETSIVRLPFNLSDDEPLSMWLEAPKTAGATSASQGSNVEQFTTNRSQTDVMLSPQCNDQSLPFSKSSPLWKNIESMEVFHMLPQKPHFQSLGSEKESSREGFAIAMMVNFAGVVDKTSNLQIDEKRHILEEYLETLLVLEKDGFDVKLPRDRITQLLLCKETMEELADKAKKEKVKMKDNNHDTVKLDEKEEEIRNQARKLQEDLALVLSVKEEKKSSNASSEKTLDDINDGMRNVELKFKAIVAAPWQVA